MNKEKMKLYKITRTEPWAYYVYNSIVVCAKSKKQALTIQPKSSGWSDELKAEYLGVASNKLKEGIILASYDVV